MVDGDVCQKIVTEQAKGFLFATDLAIGSSQATTTTLTTWHSIRSRNLDSPFAPGLLPR